MGWMHKLYETYNNCQSLIGVIANDEEVPLLPICHTTQKAQVEIVIDGKGNFKRARVVPKNEARTIIPCTESSGGRTSGEAAHPLCDKLQYVARDYVERGGAKTHYFDSYLAQLEKWCSSESSHRKAMAVLRYIKNGQLIGDLIDAGALVAGKKGKLLPKGKVGKGEEGPKIFEVLSAQDEAFVRWEVEIPKDAEPRVWRDKSLWTQWINYYLSTKSEKSLCYVSGKEDFVADQHLAKLRNDGDKAKLISSNDTAGFTFLGRFLEIGDR